MDTLLIKLKDKQRSFTVAALIRGQSLNTNQILKISQIIAALGIELKRRFLTYGFLGYLIKNPEAKFQYKQIHKILMEIQKLDKKLNDPKQARNQIKQCGDMLLYHFFSEVVKKAITSAFKTLKEYMHMLVPKNKKVNGILPEREKSWHMSKYFDWN